jgi:hypothetical protein
MASQAAPVTGPRRRDGRECLKLRQKSRFDILAAEVVADLLLLVGVAGNNASQQMPGLRDEFNDGPTKSEATLPASPLGKVVSIGRIPSRRPIRKYNRESCLGVGGVFSPCGVNPAL